MNLKARLLLSLRYLAATALLLFCAAAGAQVTAPERAEAVGRDLVGSPAPRFVVKTIDGDTIDLSSLYGKKAVYLKFWATWCGPCRAQMPHFQHTYETAGPDLAVIAINAGFDDPVDEILRFRKQYRITMPIVRDDGALGTAFHLRVTPMHVIVGRDGRIQYVGNVVDERLEAALIAARAPVPSSTVGGAVDARASIDPQRLSVGDRLPASSVKLLDGNSFTVRNSEDRRPTVLVFMSPWCESYLAATRPAISASCKRNREQVAVLAETSHVRWLGIASGLWATPDDLRKYQAENNVKIPLTLDESGALFRSFRVTNVPTVLVADARGTIVRRMELDDTQGLRAVLEGM